MPLHHLYPRSYIATERRTPLTMWAGNLMKPIFGTLIDALALTASVVLHFHQVIRVQSVGWQFLEYADGFAL